MKKHTNKELVFLCMCVYPLFSEQFQHCPQGQAQRGCRNQTTNTGSVLNAQRDLCVQTVQWINALPV